MCGSQSFGPLARCGDGIMLVCCGDSSCGCIDPSRLSHCVMLAEMCDERLAGCGRSVGCHGVTRWPFVCPAGSCTCTSTSSPAASRRCWAPLQLCSECGAVAARVSRCVFILWVAAVWCLVFGVWCLVLGACCVVWCGVVWCVVVWCGVWCVVCGVWCVVCGVCCVVCVVRGAWRLCVALVAKCLCL
jgi:hypothetical protein